MTDAEFIGRREAVADVKVAFNNLEKLVRDFHQSQEEATYSEKVQQWRTIILVSLKYLQNEKH